MRFKRIVLVSIVLTFIGCEQNKTVNKEEDKAKNVILLISDGTGLSQISSAFYFKKTAPNYARFENIGLINTSSSREDVTDSAAGATAFACGVKTYNGAIGVADDSTEVVNLIEIATKKNIKTGVVATSSITHATPASFFAHSLNRGLAEDIAMDLTKSDVDFFAGGGLKYFNKRADGENLLEDMTAQKFLIDTTSLNDVSALPATDKLGYLLAQTAMPRITGGRGDFLVKATDLGIQFLGKDDANFFMMVEGSQIDWGGHDNDGDYIISELVDFDEAIGKALDFAEKDGNTLVVVTSDHETGGFTLAAKTRQREDGTEYSDYSEIGMKFSTSGHSATLIPVFAYGPGSEEFNGIYENNEIFDKILKVTDWNTEK